MFELRPRQLPWTLENRVREHRQPSEGNRGLGSPRDDVWRLRRPHRFLNDRSPSLVAVNRRIDDELNLDEVVI